LVRVFCDLGTVNLLCEDWGHFVDVNQRDAEGRAHGCLRDVGFQRQKVLCLGLKVHRGAKQHLARGLVEEEAPRRVAIDNANSCSLACDGIACDGIAVCQIDNRGTDGGVLREGSAVVDSEGVATWNRPKQASRAHHNRETVLSPEAGWAKPVLPVHPCCLHPVKQAEKSRRSLATSREATRARVSLRPGPPVTTWSWVKATEGLFPTARHNKLVCVCVWGGGICDRLAGSPLIARWFLAKLLLYSPPLHPHRFISDP
jgi:hypothetical protein